MKLTYNATKIETNVLGSSNESIPFDSTKIQWIGTPDSADLSEIWPKISALNLVKCYRKILGVFGEMSRVACPSSFHFHKSRFG